MNEQEGLEEAITTLIITMPVLKHAEIISSKDAKEPFPQYLRIRRRMRDRSKASSECMQSPNARISRDGKSLLPCRSPLRFRRPQWY
jgi:hypothetical protein